MLFDILEYNPIRLWLFLILLLAANIRNIRKASTLLDPQVYLIFFLSTINAVTLELAFFQNQSDAYYFLVMGVFTNLLVGAFARAGYRTEPCPPESNWFSLTAALIGVRFIIFDIRALEQLAETRALTSVWHQASIERQASVDVLRYLVHLIVGFFEVYVLTYNIVFSKIKTRRFISGLLLLWGVFCLYLSGSRAGIFYYAISIGQFCVYFRGTSTLIAISKWINFAALIAFGIFLTLMVSYSALGETGSDKDRWLEASKVVANRVFANADGVVYFIQFEKGIEASPLNFFKYNFIVINKRIFGEEYPNLGRRLYEYVIGRSAEFGGPNFTIVLQARIIAGWFGFLYIFLVVYFWSITRSMHFTRGTLADIYMFNVGHAAFWMFIESEAQIVRLMLVTAILLPALVYFGVVERRQASKKKFI